MCLKRLAAKIEERKIYHLNGKSFREWNSTETCTIVFAEERFSNKIFEKRNEKKNSWILSFFKFLLFKDCICIYVFFCGNAPSKK